MANIKRGFKRIERVLLVLGCLGALGSIALGLWQYSVNDIKINSLIKGILTPSVFSFVPYIIYKFISWLVMGLETRK